MVVFKKKIDDLEVTDRFRVWDGCFFGFLECLVSNKSSLSFSVMFLVMFRKAC